ncbi:hypothetical protein CRM22_003759 [Opisthorchis felineus]|uniref:MD-2-related lipid-recognition domain-containing protein n=1 Tax=Opisthorchis felineus TaxID=147828 RepID=A0A4S2LZP1_OPIFE|nr:hypothetical protein CRM22_003759 [Opisthorchis felineus]
MKTRPCSRIRQNFRIYIIWTLRKLGLRLAAYTMRLFILLTFSVPLCLIRFAEAVRFTDCGSRGVVPTSVHISVCNRDPCTLTKGTTITITINFVATSNVSPGGALIRGMSAGERSQLPMPHNGVCGRVIPPCPIQTGETYAYYYTGEVPNSLPTGLMTIRWELLNFHGAPFLCVEFRVLIAQAP